MIPGIVASISTIGGGPSVFVPGHIPDLGMGVGEAFLDFVNGTFLVEGVLYTDIRDLFDDAPTGFGMIEEGDRLVAGRGFVSDYSGDLGAVAIGPLLALMTAPHCVIAEFEDMDQGDEGMVYVQGAGQYATIKLALGNFLWTTVSAVTGDATELINEVSTPFYYGGTNRFAYNLGSTNTNWAMNGSPPEQSDVDGTDVFAASPYPNDQPMPLGAWDYDTNWGAVIRWIAIRPPVADTTADLTPYSVILTPAQPGSVSVVPSTTSAALTFTDAVAATSHEVCVVVSPNYPGANSFALRWQFTALDGSKIVTGLTSGTIYHAAVRGVNTYGPGPIRSFTFTTT